MLGALAMKWKWRERREKEKKGTEKPNLIFGGDVHVVWEKFCRYFDVEPRIVPLQEDKLVIGPEDVEPHLDENTIGVAAVVGTTFTGTPTTWSGSTSCCWTTRRSTATTSPCTWTAPAAPSCGPSSIPTASGTSAWSRSSRSTPRATSSASSIPGIGWLVFRDKDCLPEDLVFYEDYLGKRDATFTLNFSTGSAMVLAQYYNFIRFGRSGYEYMMQVMQSNRDALGERIADVGLFEAVGEGEQLPLAASG